MEKTQTGLNVSLTKNPSSDDFDKIRAFLGSDFYASKDAFFGTVYGNQQDVNRDSSIVNKAPFALANRYALFTWMGLHGERTDNFSKFYRDSIDNTLVQPEISRIPTVKKIVNYFSDVGFGGIEYSYSDFLYCKYFNQIPNNHLLTLRRFATPCEDNIYKNIKLQVKVDGKGKKVEGSDPIQVDKTVPDMARAVTWMSEKAGNKMDDLLSFSYGYNWKEHEAETSTKQTDSTGYTGQPFYAKLGVVGQSFFDTLKGVNAGEKARRLHFSGHDALKETYENFVIGPVNVINKMMTRDVGLKFDQDIKLVFEYQLKSYNGLNPKVAMLDIFANLMVLTYSNANFWGGANRFMAGGGYVASRFGDENLLINGDFVGYFKSVVTEVSGGFNNVFGTADGGFSESSVLDGLKKVGGTLLGNMMGGFINNLLGSAPAYVAAKGFITGEPTGNWHVTVGNPMNPIAMMGNLILDSSKITFHGGMGADDFPNELRLEVTLKHARPRDKTDFESSFNAGKGRLYAAAQNFEDVLNLSGKDVQAYGAFQHDSKGKSKGKSTIGASDLEKEGSVAGGHDPSSKEKHVHFGKWKGKSDKYLDSVDRIIHT